MDLFAYIQGKRKGKEANRIEKEAMRDPFLADAMEGYDAVQADHAKRIAHLSRRIAPKATFHILPIGIAASLLLCLSIGGYFLLESDPDSLIAMNDLQQQVIAEEHIEISPHSESAPHPVYLTDNESITGVEGEIRQQETTVSPMPVASAASGERMVSEPAVVYEPDAQVQNKIAVLIEEEATDVALDAKKMANSHPEEKEYAEERTVAEAMSEEDIKHRSIAAFRTTRGHATHPAISSPAPLIGIEAYQKYLNEEMISLKNAQCATTKGVVEVEFTIKEGKPHGFVVKSSFCDAATKEAIRLIENGSTWIGDDGQKVIWKVTF